MGFKSFILLSIAVFLIFKCSYADEKNLPKISGKWYENAVWYQVFPDRFNAFNQGFKTALTDNYDKYANIIHRDLVQWDNDRPTNFDKYGGNLQGIISKLKYLKELGINAIWLNPIFIATSNHRYNTSDYLKIDPLLGTEEDFDELLNKAHKLGIKIILDGVFNHTGYEFWAFQDIVKNGKNSRYKDWYTIKSYPVRKLYQQDAKHPANYECWWNIGSLPKLNYKNPEVRDYIFSVTKKWMTKGIDGWRLDVPQEIKEMDFWQDWCKLVRTCNPDAFILGEIWDNASEWVNTGELFNASMNYYGFREPVLRFFSAEKTTVSEFDKELNDIRKNYSPDANYSMVNLLGSHDTARISSVIFNKDLKDSDKEKKGYKIGNVDELTLEKLRIIYLFQMTYVGCPIIYYGDEIGMEGGKDPDCRRPMQWDESKQNKELFNYIKNLIKIRDDNPALRTGIYKTVFCDDKKKIYSYLREKDKDKFFVIFKYSPNEHKAEIILPDGFKNAELKDLITNKTYKVTNYKLTLNMNGYSGYILREN